MYKYVRDNVFLKQMGRDCIGHLKSLRKIINNDKRLRVDFKLLGDDPLTMTIQDGINPLEIPFSLEILEMIDSSLNETNLKKYLMDCFDKIEGSAFGTCIDARYGIDTKYIWYTTGNNTKFKLFITIIINKEGELVRLIQTKDSDSHVFEPIDKSLNIYKKELKLKQLNLYEKVRVAYLNKKNKYLRDETYANHPSIDCYIEAINEVYKKNVK